jgi:hypothetical protein
MTQNEVELKIKEAIQSQQPVWLGVWVDIERGDFPVWLTLGNKPPQRTEERNFCSRCGKRTADLTTIHTCTPPMEKDK